MLFRVNMTKVKNYKLDEQDKKAKSEGYLTVGIIVAVCLGVAGLFHYVLTPLYS